MNNNDLLKYALENGMINLSCIQEEIEMRKRNEMLEKHPYKIWKGKDGFWHTYIPDKEKGRIHKKRISQESIEDVVVDYWKKEIENPKIEELYNEWISSKLEREEISYSTKNRYDRQYNESMKEFGKNRIKDIEEYDIEEFLLNAIHEHSLTAKGYSNLRTIVYGIFRRAKKRKLIDFSITEVIKDMDISRKSFRKISHTDEELVFMEDEVPKVIDYILNTKPDIIGLGIILLFKTGLRPGELAALTKSDVNENFVNVHRTEIRYKTKDGETIYEVRDFPKTEAGIRKVIIPHEWSWIIHDIKKQNPFGKYLFERNGKRIRTYVFSQRLETICKHLNIVNKSPNKIRKTYGTILIDGNVEESLIISQMGHTNIKTTKSHYYRNRKTEDQKIRAINNVHGL